MTTQTAPSDYYQQAEVLMLVNGMQPIDTVGADIEQTLQRRVAA